MFRDDSERKRLAKKLGLREDATWREIVKAEFFQGQGLTDPTSGGSANPKSEEPIKHFHNN